MKIKPYNSPLDVNLMDDKELKYEKTRYEMKI